MRGYAFIDIKTTGSNCVLDRIVRITISTFTSSLKPQKNYSYWLNPNINLSDSQMAYLGITEEFFSKHPTFEEISEHLYEILKDRVWGTFSKKKVNVLEFLLQSFFFADVDVRYKRSKFVIVDEVEEKMFPRTIDNLLRKYANEKVIDEDFSTTKVGDIYKYQCEMMGVDPSTFDYSNLYRSHKKYRVFDELYDYDDEDRLIFLFGKYRYKPIDEVPEDYLYWMLESDFPNRLKQIIMKHLGYELK